MERPHRPYLDLAGVAEPALSAHPSPSWAAALSSAPPWTDPYATRRPAVELWWRGRGWPAGRRTNELGASAGARGRLSSTVAQWRARGSGVPWLIQKRDKKGQMTASASSDAGLRIQRRHYRRSGRGFGSDVSVASSDAPTALRPSDADTAAFPSSRPLRQAFPDRLHSLRYARRPTTSQDGDGGNNGDDSKQSKPRAGLNSAIITKKPNIKWNDIAGLERAKQALQEAVILPVKFPAVLHG
ncbi:vacuolar protein sorting-associated protein 4 [Panicum miliaceum]|uniref:Vacuolar protein sorting-associated protein 4 n=1 Tax=Panicum miliaceum TaxID=4540 RepID=A0A3L6RKQ9_PANMI|nr:vacuolar protein sorting-associated protein 4 [Panicum miliaceum]